MYAHFPNVLGNDGKKLSKRHGAVSVDVFRAEGYLPAALMNFLALLGWSYDDKTTVMSRHELIERFSLDRVGPSPATFDYEKLDWLNGVHLRALPPDEYAHDLLRWLGEQGIDWPADRVRATVPLVQQRIEKFSQYPDSSASCSSRSARRRRSGDVRRRRRGARAPGAVGGLPRSRRSCGRSPSGSVRRRARRSGRSGSPSPARRSRRGSSRASSCSARRLARAATRCRLGARAGTGLRRARAREGPRQRERVEQELEAPPGSQPELQRRHRKRIVATGGTPPQPGVAAAVGHLPG